MALSSFIHHLDQTQWDNKTQKQVTRPYSEIKLFHFDRMGPILNKSANHALCWTRPI